VVWTLMVFSTEVGFIEQQGCGLHDEAAVFSAMSGDQGKDLFFGINFCCALLPLQRLGSSEARDEGFTRLSNRFLTL